jgi:hypothetical protein
MVGSRAGDVTLDVEFGPSWTGPRLMEALDRLYNQFNSLINALGAMIGGSDELQFSIMSPGLDVPIFVPLHCWTELTVGYILEHVKRTLQSKAKIPLDAGFTVHVSIFRCIGVGYGGRRDGIRFAGNFTERDARRKRGIVFIDNKNDNTCLPRAIAVRAFHQMKSPSEPLPGRPTTWDEPAALRYIVTCFEKRCCSEETYRHITKGPDGRNTPPTI